MGKWAHNNKKKRENDQKVLGMYTQTENYYTSVELGARCAERERERNLRKELPAEFVKEGMMENRGWAVFVSVD